MKIHMAIFTKANPVKCPKPQRYKIACMVQVVRVAVLNGAANQTALIPPYNVGAPSAVFSFFSPI